MQRSIAVVGAGVSGLTCGVRLAERGYRTAIFAGETGQSTTSGAAAAIWFPYDAEPVDHVIPWALETYRVLVDLSRESDSGVSMIELRQFSRTSQIQIPEWARTLGARFVVPGEAAKFQEFTSGFAIAVPLTDTTIYLDYLVERFLKAGGKIHSNACFAKLEDVDPTFGFVVNCTGIGARALVNDADLEPHRGQVAIVPKIDNLSFAVVCDDAPLMYAIPRSKDCVFGGTNELSDDLAVDSASTASIVSECARILKIENPKILRERVGLRPFRKSGVRVDLDRLRDGRAAVHNYGHGGSGFTLSWGCARQVIDLVGGAP
ncbi:MAG: FAD-dependent oxidoreductase [Verrucomicrobiota bacterium]